MTFIMKVLKSFITSLRVTALEYREDAIMEMASKPTGEADAFGIAFLLKEIREEKRRLLEGRETK